MRSKVCAQIGRRIRALRRERGVTQRELAHRSEIARETLSIIEHGRRDVGIVTLARIIKALGLDWEAFFRGIS